MTHSSDYRMAGTSAVMEPREDARGCKIEHDAAVAYGLEVLYEN